MISVGRRDEPAADSLEANRLVELGRIANIHGVRGEVRVRLHNPDSTLLGTLPSVTLQGAGTSAPQVRRILAARPHKRFFLVRFAGVETANDAQHLVGHTVSVTRQQLPPVGPGEAYHADLIGCRVHTDGGEDLGVVREIVTTGSNDVCVVEAEGREHLIPLIDDVLVRLDVTGREIVVRSLPGLLEP